MVPVECAIDCENVFFNISIANKVSWAHQVITKLKIKQQYDHCSCSYLYININKSLSNEL